MVMGAGSVPVCSAPERLAPLWRRAVARTHREGMAHTAAYHEGPSVALRLVTAAWDDGAARRCVSARCDARRRLRN